MKALDFSFKMVIKNMLPNAIKLIPPEIGNVGYQDTSLIKLMII